LKAVRDRTSDPGYFDSGKLHAAFLAPKTGSLAYECDRDLDRLLAHTSHLTLPSSPLRGSIPETRLSGDAPRLIPIEGPAPYGREEAESTSVGERT
jgi:hypothetical protein